MKTFKKIIGTLLVLILITGCGFHLRKANHLSPELQNISLEPHAPWSTFQRQLRQQLHDAGARFDQHPTTIVFIKDEKQTQTNLAYGANGQVNRVRTELSIDFEVHDAKGNIITTLQHIVVARDYGVNPNSQLASDDEKELIMDEMHKEAAIQLVRRLMSVERAPQKK